MGIEITQAIDNKYVSEVWLEGERLKVFDKRLYRRHLKEIYSLKTKQEVLEWFSRVEKSLTRGYVYKLLAFKGFMTGELKSKLEERKISSHAIDKILEECKRLGYLDDKREAKLFIERAKRKGWGPFIIKNRLKAKLKGCAHEENFKISKEDQVKQIEKWLEKKYRGSDYTEIKVKQRIFRFLKGKGFDERLIREQLFDME